MGGQDRSPQEMAASMPLGNSKVTPHFGCAGTHDLSGNPHEKCRTRRSRHLGDEGAVVNMESWTMVSRTLLVSSSSRSRSN